MLNMLKTKLLRSKKSDKGRGEPAMVDSGSEKNPAEVLARLRAFEQIKDNPLGLTGEDFDRAFAFLEQYPDTPQAKQLIEEMIGTRGARLKGLSYESAIRILTQMPDHPGAESIIRGMYKIEPDYVSRLTSDVLMFMLEIAPDHPQAQAITEAIVAKNLTSAYGFITKNPLHQLTRTMIAEMFKADPNIAILLLQEKMDHPQVAAIIDGIYAISLLNVRKLTPNAIIFILDIAPDHPLAERLIKKLVRENYIKAFDFIKEHMEYPNADLMVREITRRKPELQALLAAR